MASLSSTPFSSYYRKKMLFVSVSKQFSHHIFFVLCFQKYDLWSPLFYQFMNIVRRVCKSYRLAQKKMYEFVGQWKSGYRTFLHDTDGKLISVQSWLTALSRELPCHHDSLILLWTSHYAPCDASEAHRCGNFVALNICKEIKVLPFPEEIRPSKRTNLLHHYEGYIFAKCIEIA